MKHRIKLACSLAALMTLAGIGSSYAEDPEQAFSALIARGFKIVGTFSVPYKGDMNNMQAVVTLQLDKAVAVCTISNGSWENMTQATLDDPKNCDVRFYGG